MNILVVTPLFPPDVSIPAVYAKELVSGLSSLPNTSVTCIHYGQYPETAGGASFISIKKNVSSLQRLFQMSKVLISHFRYDVVILLNGQSVELPYLITNKWSRTRLIFIDNDTRASRHATKFKTLLRNMTIRKARSHITPDKILLNKPIIYPFLNTPQNDNFLYSSAWQKHLELIISLCQN